LLFPHGRCNELAKNKGRRDLHWLRGTSVHKIGSLKDDVPRFDGAVACGKASLEKRMEASELGTRSSVEILLMRCERLTVRKNIFKKRQL
jgi:hypothetical protein